MRGWFGSLRSSGYTLQGFIGGGIGTFFGVDPESGVPAAVIAPGKGVEYRGLSRGIIRG